MNDVSTKVMEKRGYLKKKSDGSYETFEEAAMRLSTVAAACEKPSNRKSVASEFYDVISSRKFFPNSPAWTEVSGQRAACFVLPVEDTMDGIMTAVRNGSLVHKSGGGTGYSFSRLREKDSVVGTTGGVASGPLSFMEVFNTATGVVKQGATRRGANMGCLLVTHPDILDFIDCKHRHESCASCGSEPPMANFNLSVCVTNSFMHALEHGAKEFELISPLSGKTVRTLDPQMLWDKIVDAAWRNGEPGVLFIDTINKHNPTPDLGAIESSNPCQPAEAVVAKLCHDSGDYSVQLCQIGDVNVGDFIVGGNGSIVRVAAKQSAGVKPVYRYISTGGVFLGTEDHNVYSRNQKMPIGGCQVVDSAVVDRADLDLVSSYSSSADQQILQSIVDGLLTGDGMVHKASNDAIFLCIGANDSDYHSSEIAGFIRKHRPGVKPCAWEVTTTLSAEDLPPLSNRTIPDSYFFGADASVMAAFLRGLFSANGSVVGKHRVALKTNSLDMATRVQMMLSMLGIFSNLTVNKPKTVEFANGAYACSESYDVNVSALQDVVRFASAVGFIQSYKTVALAELIASRKHVAARKVRSRNILKVEYTGAMEVFDITVDSLEHTYWSGGLKVCNCGEVPLLPYEACILGSVNVAAHIFHEGATAQVDWNSLSSTIKTAVRYLDNLISVSEYPLPEIQDAVERTRKIGVGVMGFADALIELGIAYASDAGVEFGRMLMEFIKQEADLASIQLAGERGPCPAFCNRDDKSEAPRNATRTTIAPTGTISLAAGCSQGIEPLMGVTCIKTLEGGAGTLTIVNESLMARLLELGYEEDSPMVNRIKSDGRIGHIEELPHELRDLYCTATEIPAIYHLRVQAAFQAYTDNAVSKTINLPFEAKHEDVDYIYRQAYKLGLKGLTVYRNDSRSNQPLKVGTKSAVVVPAEMPVDGSTLVVTRESSEVTDRPNYNPIRPRGEVFTGSTWRADTGCGNLYVTVNSDDIGPAEIFLNMGDSGGCVQAWAQALGKCLSLAMRAGFDVRDVVAKLTTIRCPQPHLTGSGHVLSCPHALAMVLEKAVGNGKDVPVDRQPCPHCGASMSSSGGCMVCQDCGFSKC